MSNTPKKWSKLTEKLLQKTRVFDILERRMRSPDGNYEDEFYSIHSLDWVNVIPITHAGEVVLISQFRHGIQDVTLEVPGGMLNDKDEEPQLAALRELKEETGYGGGKLTSLGFLHNNPAILTNRCHIYVAQGVEKVSEQSLDPAEDIAVMLCPLEHIPQLITNGAISHSLIIAAFLKFFIQTNNRVI